MMIFYALNQVMSKQEKHKIQKFSKLQAIIKISKIIITLQVYNKKDKRKQSSFQVHNHRDRMLDLNLLQHTFRQLKKSVKSQNHNIKLLIKRVGRSIKSNLKINNKLNVNCLIHNFLREGKLGEVTHNLRLLLICKVCVQI